MTNSARQPVFGVGLQKTGTTTLGDALRIWGFKHQSYSDRGCHMYANGAIQELLEWSDHFESCDDVPWLMLYRELEQRHPNARFILTRRSNPNAWFRSLCKHSQRMGAYKPSLVMNKAIYGRADPENDKAGSIQIYHKHLEEVRDWFRPRPQKLIELCWEEGDAWEELAQFLGLEAPNAPFPHSNKAPSLWQRYKRAKSKHQRRLSKTIGDKS